MDGVNRKRYIPALSVALLVALAYSIRFIDPPPGFWQVLLLVRAGIYVGLYIAWGVSVRGRLIQPGIRRMFTAIAMLMGFWMTVRTIKYLLPFDSALARYCWYFFYVGMLFIPLLAIMVAAYMGRPDGYCLPGWVRWLCVVVGALLLLVLTNDLHQSVFVFPAGKVFTDRDYSYGPGFIPVAVWQYGGLLVILGLIWAKSRLPGRGKRLLVPVIPAVLLVAYNAIYLLGFPWLRMAFGDMTAIACLLIICILECCLRTGLIPSNTRYAELFAAADLAALITDADYQVQFASGNMAKLPAECLRKTENGPVLLDEKTQLQGMAVTGGHIIWTTDLSELLELQERLEMTREELAEGNEALRHAYEEEQEYQRIREQNRLYDALQHKTQRQIDQINRLAGAYHRAGSAQEKRRILSRIILLGSFVKRRKDFVLSMDAVSFLPEGRLRNAFAESYRALGLMGVQGSYLVQTGKELLEGELLTNAYDFFEDFIEEVLDSLRAVNVTVCPVRGRLRVSILADCGCEACELAKRYPKARIEVDEDGVTAVLPLELGGGSVI